MSNSKLLLDEEPLLIMPQLAIKIGLNESIVLQQIHYWNQINKKSNTNLRDGYYWAFNSYEQWQIQFPFWSVMTIRRTITKLEKMNLIVVGNYNRLKLDRTKWYRINYKVLDNLDNTPCVQNEQTSSSKRTNQVSKKNRPLPETNSEINLEEEETTQEVESNINILNTYKDCISKDISNKELEILNELQHKVGKEILNKAIIIANMKNGKNLGYIQTVIDDWIKKGFTTLEQVDTYLAKWLRMNEKTKENRIKQTKNKAENKDYGKKESVFNNFEQRTYDYDDLEKKLLGIK